MSPTRWLVVPLVLALAPAAGFAADPRAPAGFPGVQADGAAMVSVNVAQLWDAPALKPLHVGLAKIQGKWTKGFEDEYGLKVEEVERVTYYWSGYMEEERRPEAFRIVTARKPFDRAKLVKAHGAVPAEEITNKEIAPWVARLAGKNIFFRNTSPIIFADDRTLIFAPSIGPADVQVTDFLKVLGDTTPKVTEGPLADALAAAGKHTLVAGIDFFPVRKALADLPALPAEFKPLSTMAQAERGLFTFDFGPTLKATAKLTFFDVDTAKKAEPEGKKVYELALSKLGAFRKLKDRDGETDAVLRPLFDFATAALDRADVKRDGQVLSASVGGEIEATMKKTLAALPPWVDVTSDRMKSAENLKQIGLSMHGYFDSNEVLPQDITDKDGKAILSWRVHVLAFCDDALYKKIDRTKPWDDAANKSFVEQMPEVFKYYGQGREPKEKGFTYFQMFTAPEAVEGGNPFLVPGRKIGFQHITDGTSNTFMVVEGETAVNWLKPGDLPYSAKKLPKLGDAKTGKFLVVMGDGSVRRLDAKKLGNEKLHALITIDGGEVVNIDE